MPPSDLRDEASPPSHTVAYRLGEVLQGLVYGTTTWLAVCELLTLANDMQIFRYQGF